MGTRFGGELLGEAKRIAAERMDGIQASTTDGAMVAGAVPDRA
jgi:hypothetical protein